MYAAPIATIASNGHTALQRTHQLSVQFLINPTHPEADLFSMKIGSAVPFVVTVILLVDKLRSTLTQSPL
jgi:hypothetical protein